MNIFNKNNLEILIKNCTDNPELLNVINRCLESFEKYHSTIYSMEVYTKLFNYNNTDKENYQDVVTRADRSRRALHNSLLTNVNILNRLAERQGVSKVYDGTVSEERPYRREVANAVLAFVEEIIKERR